MSLLNPTALLWFALAIPIVVFYILKVRLRRVPVATTLFWRQIFEQKQPRSIWQQLRHLLSLLVQMALLALLVFALAEPFFRSDARKGRRIVLIVDNSASMNANDVKPDRLERARQEGLRIIDALRFTDEMAILGAGAEPRVFLGLTDHQGTLRDALKAIPATDGPTRVAESVELARRLLGYQKNRNIIILSDGCFEASLTIAKADDVEVRLVGERNTPNIGITRFQVRRSLVDPIGYEILVEVGNFAETAAECRLDLDLDDQVVDVVPLTLKPGEIWIRTFEKTSAQGGRLTAKLDQIDALTADNQTWAILPSRDEQPVTLITEGNLFLQKVIEAIPLVRLTLSKTLPQPPRPGLNVYHRQVPRTLPPGPALVIEPSSSTNLWQVGPELVDPIVASQDAESPLMAHIKLDNVSLPEARQLTFKTKVHVLASTVSGDPLYAVIDRPEGKVLVLTVNLDQGDLPLQTAFPILMTNALSWFSGIKGELRESVASGALTELELPPDLAKRDDLVLRAPDGQLQVLHRDSSRALIGPLDHQGVWGILPRPLEATAKGTPTQEARAADLEIACNLASRSESDLRPPEGLTSAHVVRGGWGGRPIWYYLIVTAWLLAALEWFLYQRRWIH
ncbi:MAG: BatA and WFA domain-containing protein [Isosphaeraceae bacterium]